MRFSVIFAPVLAMGVNAFFRMECRSRSGTARMDPIASFGKPSDHIHDIYGSAGFSETSGYAELSRGACTSCSVAQDKSAYWVVPLMHRSKSGQYRMVPVKGGMLAYYLFYPNPGSTSVTAFPNGFRMIAGDTNRRNFTLPVPDPPKSEWANDPQQSSQDALRQKAIGFNCLNYAGTPEGAFFRHYLPDKAFLDANCNDGLRLEVMFPSCWNGQLDSPDHKSHVAYSSLVMDGDCPPDYPTRLISMSVETIYDTHAFAGQDGEFILANGDTTGYGYHGDFLTGWDAAFLQQVVDKCTNLSGKIEDCPLFNIQPEDVYSSCKFPIPPALSSECAALSSPMTAIPGNVQVPRSPGYAELGEPAAGSTPATTPTIPSSAGSSIASVATEPPSSLSPTSSPTSVVAPTPAPAGPPALLLGQKILSTAYSTNGREAIEIVYIEQDVTVTVGDSETTSTPAVKRKREHARLHGRRGRR